MKFIILVFSMILVRSVFAQNEDKIKINQVGFYPTQEKIALITVAELPGNFYIINKRSKDTVFHGRLANGMSSKNSSTITRAADFSNFKTPGVYQLVIEGLGNSYPFEIKNKALEPVVKSVLKGFYYQRASMPIEEKYAGKWARKEGHPDTLVFIHPSATSPLRKEGMTISTPGGWYDAGDYNKYIVNSGITMGTLFAAYEDMPGYFKNLNTSIPESDNAIPDILDEAIYNLRWMLTMQDPEDGGVYHKCTNAVFDPMVMPDKAIKPRYVVAKSTAAALDFAAVMAQASRILRDFKKQLPRLSDSCLSAAERAWKWAIQHDSIPYDQKKINELYKPAITTGEYGDRHFSDEFFWAATELYISTQKTNYLSELQKNLWIKPILPSWSNVTLLGYYSLIRKEQTLTKNLQPVILRMKDTILKLANQYTSLIDSNAFHCVIGGRRQDFIWGSNAVASNQGILLINAYKISGNKKYLKAAQTNVDYILGRNATGYCFITGIGSKSTKHPHHRPSIADGIEDPVPGLLAGGPNPGQQDKCHYDFNEPETSYADIDCAYASNEIAINWNAPLVYLIASVEHFLF
jgi:Glycosyl hydrolase family 9./N-terminal ig-like domain of cellulase.